LIEQSASGMGNAFAGASAVAEDASTIFFNPAGMSYLQGKQISVAAHAIRPSAEFQDQGSVAGAGRPLGNDGGDAGSWALVPNFFYAMELNPSVRIGLGINAPFGLKTNYNENWIGRFQALKSEVKTININPSVAFKVNEQLSLGFGVSAMRAEAELTQAVNLGAAESAVRIKGNDWGYGFNLGAIYQVTPDTRIGLAYRSKVEQHLVGDATFAAPLSALNGGIKADVTLPETLSVSIFNHLGDKWDILADATWTRWSQFKELRVVRDNGTLLALTPENWENTMRYSLGANYRYNDAWKLRAGIAYDQEPIKDQFRTARIPGNDRTWLALGANWQLSDASKLDFGYAHLFVKDASIDINQTPVNGRLRGKFDNQVNILSAQFTYSF
jgi:long-chain fatty acid transport protein